MLDMLGNPSKEMITTEGIKYAGSKTKLISPIVELVSRLNPSSVFDGFAGTTRVSQAFARLGYSVVCNDKAIWSKTFAECYLNAFRTDEHYQAILNHLNSLKPRHGWFSEHYGGEVGETNSSFGVDGLKKPFQMSNANKLDAIRDEIDHMNLEQDEKNVAITSLILGLERVDSTLGHYVAYLKEWSPRSYRKLHLELPQIVRSGKSHLVYNDDTVELTKSVDSDVAYFDPPYGSNNKKMPPSRVRYESYYHLWKTVILNDQPTLFGAAKRRTDCSDTACGSEFEEFRRGSNGKCLVIGVIDRLIRNTLSPYILLSYSSGGRATAEELSEVLQNNGDVIEFVKISHKKNVMSQMKWTNDWLRDYEKENFEYLFLLKK